MNSNTYLLIIVSFILAMSIAWLWYKDKVFKGRLYWMLLVVRGLALWGLALLLINPVIKDYTVYTEKPVLNILADNSASMTLLDDPANIREGIEKLQNDQEIREVFDVQTFVFDRDLKMSDSVPKFDGTQTNISKALLRLKNLEGSGKSATILISDGNSTYGEDYRYNTAGVSGPVYTVVVGDSTRYEDLFIERLNVNRYAYLNNKFPVEVFPGYEGEKEMTLEVEISDNKGVVGREKVNIRPGQASPAVNFELEAGTPGLKKYKVAIKPVSDERNTDNNEATFAVDVLDQRNKVALVAEIMHPDLGSLKNILEGSNQRSVELLSPAQVKNIEDFDLYILYQPGAGFDTLLRELNERAKNYWLIGGATTDWSFINGSQAVFTREVTYTPEDVGGGFNSGFGAFQAEDPGFDGYPPLPTILGDFIFRGTYESLLFKNIGGIATSRPLLFTAEENDQRIAVLDGSGIWKWRLWHYSENESFEVFDEFWNKLVQYLASGNRKERLNISYEPFYYANAPIRINAGYYDKNFEFDPGEILQMEIRHKDSARTMSIPMMSGRNDYEGDISGLQPGAYEFTVKVPSQSLSRSGQFTILEFNVEQQFVNTDDDRMRYLADITGGKMTRLDDLSALVEELKANTELKPVQKRKENIVPLLEWQWLLFGIAALLAIEWVTRKYNGLI